MDVEPAEIDQEWNHNETPGSLDNVSGKDSNCKALLDVKQLPQVPDDGNTDTGKGEDSDSCLCNVGIVEQDQKGSKSTCWDGVAALLHGVEHQWDGESAEDCRQGSKRNVRDGVGNITVSNIVELEFSIKANKISNKGDQELGKRRVEVKKVGSLEVVRGKLTKVDLVEHHFVWVPDIVESGAQSEKRQQHTSELVKMFANGRHFARTLGYVSRRYASDFQASHEAFLNDISAASKTVKKAVPYKSVRTSTTTTSAPTSTKSNTTTASATSTPAPETNTESTPVVEGTLSQMFESSLNDGVPLQGDSSHNWSETFHGLANQAFPKESQKILSDPLPDDDIEITPDGLLYLPEIKYRRILNRAFGPGAWGLAPRSETLVSKSGMGGLLTREYGLVIYGRLVSIARGEQTFFSEKGIPTATEGCKSNALMRCCKDLGIASELWDPRFIKKFKKKNCEEVFVEYVPTKRKKKIWKRKDEDIEYPYKKNVWLTGLCTNDKHVRESGDESVLQRILDVDQVETSLVLLSVSDNTHSTQVTTTGHHDQSTGVELNKVGDLSGLKINLDGVVDFDSWIWVSESSTIVGNNVRDTLLTKLDLLDLAQFVRSLLGSDSVDSESTFNIVDESEVLVGSIQSDDIHETSWEGRVGSHLAVDLDVSLHQDGLDFSTVQSIL
ncbi:hypothetical protein OGAPHI_004349 [Ogataea philodendri]|uniref:Mitochondrial genome maintenance protein MGM101 n=1 Tax=Ogataea philodendri TaxID=1378263 RepID=A0A9P8P6Y2_9ASCO|nr:uncharacterized protein OGAPHI_004349 [Ogataea philodendri]KAH3666160.1 hypothetical protein OGAPHI_004349 [Ogataea philodendri]